MTRWQQVCSMNRIEHLAATFDEREVPRVFLRIHSELNSVTICDEIFQVALVEPFAEIIGLADTVPLGKDFIFDDGEVQLYVEDSLNDTGENGYYKTGIFYDITSPRRMMEQAG